MSAAPEVAQKEFPLKIYLAGKISKHCWRHGVVTGLRNAYNDVGSTDHDGGHRTQRNPWPILRRAVTGGFDYVGPYFTSCDHGCAHHKVFPPFDSKHGTDGGGLHGLQEEMCVTAAQPETVVSLCLEAIRVADIVFAWIDAPDCYGTIVEIGYAAALNKVIAVSFAPDFSFRTREAMWLAEACGRRVPASSVPDALLKLRSWIDQGVVRISGQQWRGEPATDKQIGLLRRYGVTDAQLRTMRKGEASDLITRMTKDEAWR